MKMPIWSPKNLQGSRHPLDSSNDRLSFQEIDFWSVTFGTHRRLTGDEEKALHEVRQAKPRG